MSYFMGLYPPNKGVNEMSQEEIEAAMPPFGVEESGDI
jgi:hypothetical protein